MLHKKIMALLAVSVVGLFGTPFELNSNGISHVYFPIHDSKSRWHIVGGSPWHKGSDTYADDWNLNAGLTAGIESPSSCDRDRGAEIVSSFSGTVLLADVDGDIGAYGKEVIIQSDENSAFAMRYAHLDSVYVTNGESVEVGTPLGTLGDSGLPDLPRQTNNNCAHLHLVLYKNLNATALDRLKHGNSAKSLRGSADIFAAKFHSDATTGGTPANSNSISRSKALKMILDKFEISTKNAGFNRSRFGERIVLPSDVNQNTSEYDAIVVGYNRGITSGDNGKFYPNRAITLEEFITMIVRAIPIPLNNPNYKEYAYADSNSAFYKYLKVAYNAHILENKSYEFDKGIDESMSNVLLDRAFNYFRGDKSGISIYMKWKQKYVDLDLYAFSSYDSEGVTMEIDENRVVTNMNELRNSNGIVYWNKHSSSWGTNLDYDSWGGNGNQPWAGFGEERSTVDSLMVRRPGKYSFIVCYYDWQNNLNPSSAKYEMIGYKGSQNITANGVLRGRVNKGECKLGGTLTTR